MKISVVIPAYNASAFIEKTLESVLRQTSAADEIIVVDDGSTDNTVEILEKYPVKLISQKNSGAASARNAGVGEAAGDWVAFLDADDFWELTKIEELRKTLQNIHSKVVMVAHDEFEGPPGEKGVYKALHKNFNKDHPLFNQLYQGCFLSTSTMAVKRKTFLKVGGMDVRLRSAQDYDLWLRLSREGELVFIEKPLATYVLVEGSISANVSKRYHCMLELLAKHRGVVTFKEYFKRLLTVHYETLNMYRSQERYLDAFKTLLILPWAFLKGLWAKGEKC